MRLIIIAVAVGAVFASGCGASSDTNVREDAPSFASHEAPVCLIRAPIPEGLDAVEVGDMDAAKRWYGSTDEVLSAMADDARSKGINLITNLETYHSTNFIAWARPVAQGTGYHISNPQDFDCKKYDGVMR